MAQRGLSKVELEAERAAALPTKEVLSLLYLDANIDLALALAAPVDLAVAANLNIAAPIDAAVAANVLSTGSEAVAAAPQQAELTQLQSGSAVASAPQDALVDQTAQETTDGSTTDGSTTDGTTTDGSTTDGSTTDGTTTDPVGDATQVSTGSLLDGNLLDVKVDVDADLDVAAPIAGAVAANANIAAPIDAAAAANVLSVDSTATAVASQTAVIVQQLDGVTAEATADQDAEVLQ
jgi:hypothetical protein